LILKTVFFDFGNTIIDEKPFVLGAQMGLVHYVRERLNLPDSPESLYEKLRRTPHLPAGHPLLREPRTRDYDERRLWMMKFAGSCGLPVNEAVGDELLRAYDDGARRSDCLIGGAKDVLEKLHGRYTLGIISNGYAGFVHATLAFLNLERFFETVIISQEVNLDKPDPAIFQLAMRRCRATPEHAMMVGDSYQADIQGGKSFGMRTCWINPEKKPPPGRDHDFIIESISQIPGVLDGI